MNIRSIVWLLAAAPVAAMACFEGTPAALEMSPPSNAGVVRSSWSHVYGTGQVLDAAARPLRGAQVAFVLPESSDAAFQNGTKREVRTTNTSCRVDTPGFIAPSTQGVMKMRVELVANPAVWKEVAFGIAEPPASFALFVEPWPSWDPYRASVLVAKAGQAHPTTARARVLSRQWYGWSGVPVTFTLPESGPSATFVGGSRSVTVLTDASGDAYAPEMVANDILGTVRLKVSAPGAADFILTRHANVGPTRTRAFAEQAYTMPFPGTVWLDADVTFLGHPCWPQDRGPANPLVVVRANDKTFAVAAQPLDTHSRVQGCDTVGGNHELSYRGFLRELSFGRHEISFGFEGDGVFDSSEAAQKYTVEVLPHATGTTGSGGVAWQAGVMAHRLEDAYCTLGMRSVTAGGTGGAPAAPAGVTFPWGAFRYEIECLRANESQQRVVVEFASDVPRGVKVLWHGARAGDAQAGWHEVPTSADGNRLQFVVTNGGLGDTGDGEGAVIRGVAALALPEPDTAPGNYQDLWWGGPAQSGWGVGIAQQDSRMFVTLYAYDDAGNARWWVVPGGTWSADFKTFTGSAYQPSWPTGTSKMIPGAPAGTVTLEFHSPHEATMRYDIGGRSGERAISRQPLGANDAGVRWNHAGMWWFGPHANGRGVFVAQQGSTLFAVEYNYELDAGGLTTWRVIPGGRWAADGVVFVAPGWFKVSGPSFFAGYDPATLIAERIDLARMRVLAMDRLKVSLGFVFDFDLGPVERSWEIVRQPF